MSSTPAVTLTYAVTVTEAGTRLISNTVTLNTGAAGLLTRTATIVANGHVVLLPLVTKQIEQR